MDWSVIIPILTALGGGVIALVIKTKWFSDFKQKNPALAQILSGLASGAVAHTETNVVAPLKEANVQSGGVAKLTNTQASVAQASAVDLVQSIAAKIDPRLANLPISDIIGAVENAVTRYKSQLPQATQDRLADLRKNAQGKSGRALLGLLLAIGMVAGLAAPLPGCAALNAIPLDWGSAVVADQVKVADAAATIIYADANSQDATIRMLASAGRVGAETFLRVDPNRKTFDENAVAKAAVVAMTEYVETAYPALLNGATLQSIIKDRLSIACTDTDALLGLMEAGVRATTIK